MSNIERLRKEKKMPRRVLSDLSGVPQTTIYALEKGVYDIQYAKIDTLIDLAKGLDCKVKDLLPDYLQEYIA